MGIDELDLIYFRWMVFSSCFSFFFFFFSSSLFLPFHNNECDLASRTVTVCVYNSIKSKLLAATAAFTERSLTDFF